MSIGIRTDDMPMNKTRFAGGLLLLTLLAGHPRSYAQTLDSEELSPRSFHAAYSPVDSLSADSVLRPDIQGMENRGFKAKQLILPGSLIAVGTFGVYSSAFKKLNGHIKDGMDNLRGNHFFHADNYLQYLPAVTYLTFGSIGIKSKHSFKERFVVEATAYISMAALTNIAKYSFKERRPDSEARNSFPSGHTATVFTGAELMRQEYGLGLGIGAYAVATGVAFLRLYNGRHWFNDVIAGAGVGILSARVGYWMLPLYQKWFKWDCQRANIMCVLPAYEPADHAFSLNMLYAF